MAEGAFSKGIAPFAFSGRNSRRQFRELIDDASLLREEYGAFLQFGLIMRQYMYSHDNQDALCGAPTG
jgi:hypothetical protein